MLLFKGSYGLLGSSGVFFRALWAPLKGSYDLVGGPWALKCP
jgi:hypothetical protein